MRTNTTLVINPKGGSGKTTLATNLASYFAANGIATTLMDYDPQGSTMNWLRVRPAHARRINGANAAPQKTGLRTLGMHVPAGTQQLIIDAPAGVCGLALQELVSRAHCILVPVAPSAIDIHATANFIRDLLLTGKVRANNIRIGVVANRVRKANPVYQPLERFLNALNLPLLARVSDSEVFVTAAETGIGIFELDFAVSAAERAQFLPIAEWVDRIPVAPARPVPLAATMSRPGLRVVGSFGASQPGGFR
jgi:chromosome partitioning protein